MLKNFSIKAMSFASTLVLSFLLTGTSLVTPSFAMFNDADNEKKWQTWQAHSSKLNESNKSALSRYHHITEMAKMVIDDRYYSTTKEEGEIRKEIFGFLESIWNSSSDEYVSQHKCYARTYAARLTYENNTDDLLSEKQKAWDLLKKASDAYTKSTSVKFSQADLIVNYKYYPEGMTKDQAFLMAEQLLKDIDLECKQPTYFNAKFERLIKRKKKLHQSPLKNIN